MKRVLIDQGNAVEIMYLDLYKGLNLRFEVLTAYDSPWLASKERRSFPKVRSDYLYRLT